jgi:hypothetical protein
MILRKSEQKSETMIEFINEKIILPFCTAFYSFINFLAKATIKKSKARRKKTRRE